MADAAASFCGAARPSKPKPTGVTGEGERCIVAESVESLRMSFGGAIDGGDEREVGDGCANDSRAGPAPATLLLFSSETKSPKEFLPSMWFWTDSARTRGDYDEAWSADGGLA